MRNIRTFVKSVFIVLAVLAIFYFGARALMEQMPEKEPAQAAADDIELVYDQIPTGSWTMTDSKERISSMDFSDKDIFLYNGGEAMETDIVIGDEGGDNQNYLIGVYYTVDRGVPVESFFFSTEPGDDKRQLERILDNERRIKKQGELSEVTTEASPKFSRTVIKTYSWEFKRDSDVLAGLDTRVSFDRRKGEASLNGDAASVWEITIASECGAEDTTTFRECITRVGVSGSGQELLTYAPIGNVEGEISVFDQSSLAGKYGEWRAKADKGASSLTVQSEIKAANTSGDLYLTLTNTVKMKATMFGEECCTPSPVQITVGDR